jgi:transcriptional regulator with XRE-family HTH domain
MNWLAKRAGVNRSTLIRWMSGRGDLLGNRLERLLRVVGIDLRQLVADQIIEILNRSQQTRFL